MVRNYYYYSTTTTTTTYTTTFTTFTTSSSTTTNTIIIPRYGKWDELQYLLKRYCYPKNNTTSSSIKALNIGCGNSDFSSKLADSRLGFDVTSLDFSELLINQMKLKRPDLRYHYHYHHYYHHRHYHQCIDGM